ncbi:MAG: cryptochrome/photolyase family protein [Mycobacteriales bacterium]
MGETRLLWFRRDLRLRDNPALVDSSADDPIVVPLFVLDPVLLDAAGAPRTAYLLRCLRALDESMHDRLIVRYGDPARVLPRLVAETGAVSVHLAADFGPYGAARDRAVAAALGDVPLRATGSPYAVAPGRVRTGEGRGYAVFTPYHRAWLAHGWRRPAQRPRGIRWADGIASDRLPHEPALPEPFTVPPAGEAAAHRAWRRFLDRVEDYHTERDRPDLDTTSRMSAHLKWGTIHPRTLLSDLGDSRGAAAYRRQLAWREFYADVLARRPETAREAYQPRFAALATDRGRRANERFDAWAGGRTGYPIVDAGMRQLLAEGYLHNRVRLVVASFLVKDLHLPWQRGARWFLQHLIDGDLASNQHNWQWVAGSGTDAAPYFRIFNPVTQGKRFDPSGDYVRRYVPELRPLAGPAAHEPWKHDRPGGYPAPIVDHATERREALDRLDALSR